MKTTLVLAFLLMACSLAAAEPPVFTKRSFEEANAQSIKDHKLLILDSMADWCGPCKQMDKTTWVDEKVVKWVNDNAIALQFDVDKDEELARQFKIQAMPTVIILKDGKEFDRAVGYQKPAELLSWLEAVKRGETSLDQARKAAGDRMGKDGKVDVKARYDLARKLAQGGKENEALDEYVWLWDNMLKFDRAMVGVRGSFMAGDMERLAQAHEPALKKFTSMRDALEAKLKAGRSDSEQLTDWIVLNEVVNDQARTLEWFDRVKDDPAAEPDLRRNGFRLTRLFEENGRWADLAKLSKDPVADARQKVSTFKMIQNMAPKERAEEMKQFETRRLREDISHLYAGLLAAGREDDADKVGQVLIEALDDAASRRGLVRMALEADQPRQRHLKLLDEADKADPDHADKGLRDQIPATLTETQKIDRLLETLEKSDAVFIRNGEDYTGGRAADHLRTKLKNARGRVTTAREFIEQLASKSSTSGEAYMVKAKDGETVPSKEWFTKQLESLENGQK
jgi:thiol-disulfide isomerase/thioredoxin